MDEERNPLTTLWKCDQNQAWYSMAIILVVLSHTSSEFKKKKNPSTWEAEVGGL